MNRNRLLTISFTVCKILSMVLLVLLCAYACMFIHWHFNPGFYEHVTIGNILGNNTTSVSTDRISVTFVDLTTSGVKPDTEKIFTLGHLNYFSFYLLFVQVISYFILSILIISEIQQVIQSVQEFDSFRIRNVISFRKIGLYCFLFFIVSGFLLVQTSEGNFLGLYFHLAPLGFMLASFVLAEVFREGNKLYEEQQFTV
jgi:hypothetical protein